MKQNVEVSMKWLEKEIKKTENPKSMTTNNNNNNNKKMWELYMKLLNNKDVLCGTQTQTLWWVCVLEREEKTREECEKVDTKTREREWELFEFR